MQCVILAGGFGTRISEETHQIPKPMIQIGGKPILWHIMKYYSSFGISEFIICGGYKAYVIKEYFANYFLHSQDMTVDLKTNSVQFMNNTAEDWKVTIIDTGLNTMTGGRLKKIKHLIKGTFCMTYGDGVSDVDITKLISHHQVTGKKATMTVTQPAGRFGAVNLEGAKVTEFVEKPKGDGGWINCGFFVLEESTLDFVSEDSDVWEKGPLERLAAKGELNAFKHLGFWEAMDTLRDKNHLEGLWDNGNAPWRVW